MKNANKNNVEEVLNNLATLKGAALDEYISARCQQLDDQSQGSVGLTKANAQPNYFKQGWSIREEMQLAPIFILDNPELIKAFATKLRANGEVTAISQVIAVLQKTTDSYFGKKGNPAVRHGIYKDYDLIFPDEDDDYCLTISDFKGKNVAMCFERSIFAHQILKFLGLNDCMVSSVCEIEGHTENHVFNVLEIDGKQMVLDITNPISASEPYQLPIDIAQEKATDKKHNRIYDLAQLVKQPANI